MHEINTIYKEFSGLNDYQTENLIRIKYGDKAADTFRDRGWLTLFEAMCFKEGTDPDIISKSDVVGWIRHYGESAV